MDMEKAYNPKAIEDSLYQAWESSGAFKAERVEGKKPFTIVMPPPNITGQLHMGHAMDTMMQDVPARFHRMKGDPTLWLPGTDHASIATEHKIIEKMAEEGLTKESLGREGFLSRAWEWKRDYAGYITKQLRKLGAGCDWSRERFTMDEGCSKAVTEVFLRLHEKGLIYRGNRIVQWCPVCKTALSDAEVEYEQQDSHLWHIRYPGPGGSRGVTVATTRPETMLGDTGVAVHPQDERYTDLVGGHVILPLMNRDIPVVADSYVDKEFGTGVVKMTPAHDPNDYEVAMRHNLAILRVIHDDGTMNASAGPFEGLTTLECRQRVVSELTRLGLLEKIEKHTHQVGTCYRCHTTVEPMTSTQWFVRMKPLAEPAIQAVRDGEVKFVPDRFAKTYFDWMENIKDWCISRQLWWGHRIPAWYCRDCGRITVGAAEPAVCACGCVAFTQDEDVLDTWFSSALWPFSTLGWPDKTEDLAYFYPTDMLVTGYDIIFFWVARMVFSGIAYMGKPPFHTVLIHGLVRDDQGRKMSKSLGNGIDPLEVIDKYGADALRFSLAMGVSPGNDTRYSIEKAEAARNFANKIWNASRFVFMNAQEAINLHGRPLDITDKWILSGFTIAVREVTAHINEGDFGLAAQKIYDYSWSEFCDWYIELAKSRLFGTDDDAKDTVRAVLLYVLEGILKLLHPFMPFITEAIYKLLPGTEGFIMHAAWPEADPALFFPDEAAQMQGVMEMMKRIRNTRADVNVAPGKKTRLFIIPAEGYQQILKDSTAFFQRLVWAQDVIVGDGGLLLKEKTVSGACAAGEFYIPLGDMVDIQKETQRLEKEIDRIRKEIDRASGMLANPGFTAKAAAPVIQAERDKLAENNKIMEALNRRADELKGEAHDG